MKKTMTALELSHPILAAKHSNPGLANFSHDPDLLYEKAGSCSREIMYRCPVGS